MKQQFLKDTAATFQTYIYENNRKIIVSSVFLTVYKPGGYEKLLTGVSMTVGADGLLSCGLSEVDNSAADLNYKAVVTYTYNSASYYATLFYDVVNSRLSKVITDEDIASELPQLKDKGWRVRGSAEGGSDTSIVDSELMRHENGYFTGGLAYCAGKDETREITDFISSTGTVVVAGFSSAVGAGEKYILTRSFSKEIQRAFEKIEEKLVRLGKRPHLILDPYDLREIHIYYSVAEVCKGLITAHDTFWWEMWKEYEKRADGAFNEIDLKYDSSADGYISSVEDGTRLDTAWAVRR